MNKLRYFCLFLILLPQFGYAEKHELVRKLAVFPILVDGEHLKDPAVADAWWELREAIVSRSFFVVATRQLMANRGVFEPQKTLGRADAIMLSKVVEADGLVSLFVEENLLKLKVYDGRNGQPLFSIEHRLDPAIALPKQIKKAAIALGAKFQNQFPYQAYQMTEVQDRLVRIYVGKIDDLSPGDEVQWLSIPAVDEKPLFENSVNLQVIARGKILEQDGEYLRVQILNYGDYKQIQEKALIRIPRLANKSSAPEPEVADPTWETDAEVRAHQIKSQGQSTATTALSFLAGLGAFILLAF